MEEIRQTPGHAHMWQNKAQCRAHRSRLPSTNARETNGTNDSDEAGHLTSSTKPPLYLPCSSIHQRWPTAVYCIFINKFYWLRRGKSSTRLYKKTASDQMACYNTGPTSFNFSAMYAFISLQGPQNNCGWANVWKRAYQAMQTGFFKREALNSSEEPWFYLHLGTEQSTSLQSFEWQSRSFHIKTHLLQPLQLRARISHRTPWKNNFFRVKQTGWVQLRGS